MTAMINNSITDRVKKEMVEEVLIVHHNDFDGVVAATIMLMYLEKYSFGKVKISLLSVGYDSDSAIDAYEPEKGKALIMLDFSLNPAIRMKELWQKFKDKGLEKFFIWIDHHVTAIDGVKELGIGIMGNQRTDKAGCVLTWEFCYGVAPMFRVIELVGKYDIWDKTDEAVDYLHYGLETEEEAFKAGSDFWRMLLADNFLARQFLKELTSRGQIVAKYAKRKSFTQLKSSAFYFEMINGLSVRGVCLFTAGAGSMLLDGFDTFVEPSQVDIRLIVNVVYKFDKLHFVLHIYSDKESVHCGELAQKLGHGGGHRGAAGCFMESLPEFEGIVLLKDIK